MAFLLTVGLTALMALTLVVMLFKRKGAKRIFKTLIGFLMVIGLFVFYANKACGPNAKDVEIIKLQLNAMAKHMVASGEPSSLADIDNLNYDLTECNRNETYYRSDQVVKIKNQADYLLIDDKCQFEAEGRMYEVNLWFVQHYRSAQEGEAHGTIKIKNNDTGTGMLTSFDPQYGGNNIVVDFEKYPAVYSVNTAGICSSMRQ